MPVRKVWKNQPSISAIAYEKKFKYQENNMNKEPTETKPETMHTKEELARLLNLWQQKFNEAPEGSERQKEANKKIRKYTTELKKPAKNGTTPERAKLTEGRDNE
ncbi:MAG: hypothetical protein ACYCSO_07400 [Cuniculiplasma sp.]